MLESFKRILGIESQPPFNQDAGETILDEGRMPLEDRMAWRRKMVYAGVKEVMTSFGIMGKWYKFRISQVDDRGHVYVVMIDVMKDFAVRPGSKVKGFIGIEKLIIKNIFDQYAITIKAIYWRTNDEANVFDKMKLGMTEEKPVEKEFEPVSNQEKEKFMAAVAAGMRPPPIQIGEEAYYSDVMPLKADDLDLDLSEDEPRNSNQFKTQFGEL